MSKAGSTCGAGDSGDLLRNPAIWRCGLPAKHTNLEKNNLTPTFVSQLSKQEMAHFPFEAGGFGRVRYAVSRSFFSPMDFPSRLAVIVTSHSPAIVTITMPL